jgi:hypothetical protein
MNFYTWVREGVKRAVLLGFSDAIEQIGVPHDSDDASGQLLAILRQGKPLDSPPHDASATATTGRKRLGRSLNQIVKNPDPE